jgi:hypothetical protein
MQGAKQMGTFLKNTSSKARSAVNERIDRVASGSPRTTAMSPQASADSHFAFQHSALEQTASARASHDADAVAAAAAAQDDAAAGEATLVDLEGGSTDLPTTDSVAEDPFASPLRNASHTDSFAARTDSLTDADLPAAMRVTSADTVEATEVEGSSDRRASDSAALPATPGATRSAGIAFETTGQSSRKGVYVRMQVCTHHAHVGHTPCQLWNCCCSPL